MTNTNNSDCVYGFCCWLSSLGEWIGMRSTIRTRTRKNLEMGQCNERKKGLSSGWLLGACVIVMVVVATSSLAPLSASKAKSDSPPILGNPAFPFPRIYPCTLYTKTVVLFCSYFYSFNSTTWNMLPAFSSFFYDVKFTRRISSLCWCGAYFFIDSFWSERTR